MVGKPAFNTMVRIKSRRSGGLEKIPSGWYLSA
jgi:hypothetical protein